ncbi:MAG: hypothetical protein ACW98F_00960 [Candidatus Hodarchaeales archaeon]|jgi:hypothetical protein
MKVNSINNSQYNFEWFKHLLRNKPWIVVLIPLYFIAVFSILSNPSSFNLSSLEAKYSQFGLSLLAFTLLITIGFKAYRYGFQPSWSVTFIIYAITFLGMSLEALNVPVADMDIPLLFFLWRFPMVIYVSGLWINFAAFYTDKLYAKYIPAVIISILGGLWFIANLTFAADITLAMNGFLYGIFIPMTFLFGYSWYKFSKETRYTSSSSIAWGFILIGLVYSQWTLWDPTSLNPLYSIAFTILNLSLFLILRGFNSISLKDRFEK